jgi:hypothetical protein
MTISNVIAMKQLASFTTPRLLTLASLRITGESVSKTSRTNTNPCSINEASLLFLRLAGFDTEAIF